MALVMDQFSHDSLGRVLAKGEQRQALRTVPVISAETRLGILGDTKPSYADLTWDVGMTSAAISSHCAAKVARQVCICENSRMASATSASSRSPEGKAFRFTSNCEASATVRPSLDLGDHLAGEPPLRGVAAVRTRHRGLVAGRRDEAALLRVGPADRPGSALEEVRHRALPKTPRAEVMVLSP